jgi:transcriptional regulator with XRE-family HTH domain
MEKPNPNLVECIREAIQASGISLNQLGRLAQSDSGRLSRFMRGERDLTLEAASRICKVLGLHLTAESRSRLKAPKVTKAVSKPRQSSKK